MGKRTWTKEEEALLEECYSKYMPMSEMMLLFPNKTEVSLSKKGIRMGLNKKYIKKHSTSYTADYQSYDWNYKMRIENGLNLHEMAEIADCELRTIKKWCVEKYHLDQTYYKNNKKINDSQKEIIIAGILGDGHIASLNNSYCYIECHAENQKDYMFWKYDILKDLCNLPPRYYPKSIMERNGNTYNCQPFYRLNTRLINDLGNIKNMAKSDCINSLTELGICLYCLDDAYRDSYQWTICYASFDEDEKKLFDQTMAEKFGLTGVRRKNQLYYAFSSESSIKLDNMILNYLPHDLDIVQDKIINNKKIRNRVA